MVEEDQSFTCPNAKCSRAFSNPISVEDLSTGETVSYSGCPYCLTEIAEISECSYHFGYLSERAKGKEMPEECMTCLSARARKDFSTIFFFFYLSNIQKNLLDSPAKSLFGKARL
jgi:hypothetical protein